MATAKKIWQIYLNHKVLYNLIFLSLLFLAHCFWGNMMFIVYPILAIIIILDNLKDTLSYLIFSIPFCFLNIFLSPILFLSCCVIYIVKFYFIKFFKEKSKPNLLVTISITVFLIYCLLPIGEYNTNFLIRILLFFSLFIVLCVATKAPEIFRFHFNIKLLCLSLIVASVFSLSYAISPYLQKSMIIFYINENLPRFMALFCYANVLGMFCEMLLATLAYFIVSKNFTKQDVALFIIIATIGIFTFSKTYLSILLLILFIILICRLCCDFKRTSLLAILFVVILVCLCLAFPQPIKIFADRFFGSFDECKTFQDFMNMVTTDRYDLWVEYSTYIAQNPLVLIFGRGLGVPALSTLSPHNAYIAMIYELGIVGVTLMILPIIFIAKVHKKATKAPTHWAIFIPILILCLIFCFEDLIFYIF